LSDGNKVFSDVYHYGERIESKSGAGDNSRSTIFNPIGLLVMLAKVFRFSYVEILELPYNTAIKMLLENNYLSTPEKDKVKRGGIMDFASQMK